MGTARGRDTNANVQRVKKKKVYVLGEQLSLEQLDANVKYRIQFF